MQKRSGYGSLAAEGILKVFHYGIAMKCLIVCGVGLNTRQQSRKHALDMLANKTFVAWPTNCAGLLP